LQQTLVHGRGICHGNNVKSGGCIMKIKKPAYIYTAAIIAIALFTACCLIWEQARAWADLFLEMWGYHE